MDIDNLCINTIRTLSADVVQKANSGHPGAPMGMAPMAHVLFSKIMNFAPHNPKWVSGSVMCTELHSARGANGIFYRACFPANVLDVRH